MSNLFTTPDTVIDLIRGLKLLFNEMDIPTELIPGLLAEGVQEAYPQLSNTIEKAKALRVSEDHVNTFSLADIAKLMNLSQRVLTVFLEDMEYLEKLEDEFILTDEGKENGGLYSNDEIRWYPDIVDRIYEYLESD